MSSWSSKTISHAVVALAVLAGCLGDTELDNRGTELTASPTSDPILDPITGEVLGDEIEGTECVGLEEATAETRFAAQEAEPGWTEPSGDGHDPVLDAIVEQWGPKATRCTVDAQITNDDITRPPGSEPSGSSQSDPTAHSIVERHADGSCTCRIRVENQWMCTPPKKRKPPVSALGKMLHELCHCMQGQDSLPYDEIQADACARYLYNRTPPYLR